MSSRARILFDYGKVKVREWHRLRFDEYSFADKLWISEPHGSDISLHRRFCRIRGISQGPGHLSSV